MEDSCGSWFEGHSPSRNGGLVTRMPQDLLLLNQRRQEVCLASNLMPLFPHQLTSFNETLQPLKHLGNQVLWHLPVLVILLSNH